MSCELCALPTKANLCASRGPYCGTSDARCRATPQASARCSGITCARSSRSRGRPNPSTTQQRNELLRAALSRGVSVLRPVDDDALVEVLPLLVVVDRFPGVHHRIDAAFADQAPHRRVVVLVRRNPMD